MDVEEPILYKDSSYQRRIDRVPARIADAVRAAQTKDIDLFYRSIHRVAIDRRVAMLACWEMVGLIVLIIEERFGVNEENAGAYSAFVQNGLNNDEFPNPQMAIAATNLSALIAAALNNDHEGGVLLLYRLEDIEEFCDLLSIAATTLATAIEGTDVEDPDLFALWARACHTEGLSDPDQTA